MYVDPKVVKPIFRTFTHVTPDRFMVWGFVVKT